MLKKILFLFLLISSQAYALDPIAWDYHGVFFFRDYTQMAKDILNHMWKAENKGKLALTGLNPLFWFNMVNILRDENQGDIIDALVKDYPILADHRDALLEIINDDMPIKGSLDLLEALSEQGVNNVFASNIRGDSLQYIVGEKPFLFQHFSMIFKAREDGHGAKPTTYYFKQLWDAMEKQFGPLTSVPFIDDLQENIEGALKANEKWGTKFDPILFTGDAPQLKAALMQRGYLLPRNSTQVASNSHEIPTCSQDG
jgi:phosphoglycolate phosphatase-like HAD superfamily hydrolase